MRRFMVMETGKRRTAWGRSERGLLLACAVLFALAVALTLRWRMGAADPQITIPEPALPNPNAFSFFRAAGEAMVREREIGEALSPRPEREFTREEKEALVATNASALETLRQGFAFPYHEPPVRDGFNALFPHYAQYRSLARLLVLEGQTHAVRGAHGAAMQSYLDAVQMGQEIPRGGVLIAGLVGMACQAIGRRSAWESLDALAPGDARNAARRMERLLARDVPFADTLQQEKWFGQTALLQMLDDPQRLRNVADNAGGPRVTPLLFLLYSKRRILNNYTSFMDRSIANARQPYATRPADPPAPRDPINKMLTPVLSQARVRFVETEAQNALLTTALALRAFHGERGAYPARLAELVPGYLSRVPADPFALPGTPLSYRRTGNGSARGYALYSVGPDGRDDGGRAISDPDAPRPGGGGGSSESRRAAVQAGSRGDIVAGENGF